jgi:hypothetical protein
MDNSSHRAAANTFYDNKIMLSSDEDLDGKTDLLMAATSIVNEHFLKPPRRGGSSKKWEANVDCDREDGHVRLYKDYFHPINLLYKEKAFCHQYRIYKELFLVILNGVRDYDDFFEAKYDCTGKISFSFYQKCSAAIR